MNAKIKTLIDQLTVEEKASLITGAGGMLTKSIDRLGIPAKNLADGPHGIRHDDTDGSMVSYPSLCNVGSSWNRDVAYAVGSGIADECIEDGIQMILGPGINIKRNALCGRNFEYFAEDPVLAGELGASYIRGAEDKGVATSLKHYAVNSQETNRLILNAEIDERTLREIYLTGFEIAVKKGMPTSVMCAYNKINAIWCSENKKLLTDILREEWGYQGFVVSDWGAVHDECRVLMAGLDLQMPRSQKVVPAVLAGLESGKVTMEALDNAVAHILEFALKEVPAKKPYDRQKQHDLVVKCGTEGICLLKNKDNFFPLTGAKKIAVVGDIAKKPLIGGLGSAEMYVRDEFIDAPYDALVKALPGAQVDFIDLQTVNYPDLRPWPAMRKAFANLKDYDTVLIFLGNDRTMDSEKMDRYDAHLAAYIELIIEEALVLNPNVGVVLSTGSSVFPGAWANKVKAIMQTWFAGEGIGRAVADVISGKVSPSGKLSETYPMHARTDYDALGDGVKCEYNEKWRVGYRYYDLHPEEVWYPFGHGLSYTTFAYDNLKTVKADGKVTVSFDITNTGKTDAYEVAQIYVGAVNPMMSRPVKELKDFAKVFIKAGKKETVTVTLDDRAFAYYNVMLGDWVVEEGDYNVIVGASAQDIRLTETIFIENPKGYTKHPVGSDMIGVTS